MMRTTLSILMWCSTLSFFAALTAFNGCESRATGSDLDGAYLQAPLGYVPPHELQEQVPIQIGPQPVPLIGGAPSVQLPDRGTVVELMIDEDGFRPAEIVAAPGQVVSVRLTNGSSIERNLHVDWPGAHATAPQALAPGESRTFVFTAPAQPGSYRFHSQGADNQVGRLEGRLLVRGFR